jgi:hypothetical protein
MKSAVVNARLSLDGRRLPLQGTLRADRGTAISELRVAMDMQRLLIGLGVLLLMVGIAWPLLTRIGIGRLPGDIMFQRGGATFYFPLVTCIIVSVVLSALLWLFNR